MKAVASLGARFRLGCHCPASRREKSTLLHQFELKRKEKRKEKEMGKLYFRFTSTKLLALSEKQGQLVIMGSWLT